MTLEDGQFAFLDLDSCRKTLRRGTKLYAVVCALLKEAQRTERRLQELEQTITGLPKSEEEGKE